MSIRLPNMKQIYAARDCLRDVLVNDQKLCPSVDKIEYVGQIERFGQLHYIFKFREPGGPWLVGVSGGYTSKDQIEPGEYVGSMGDAYNEGTVKGSAIALLDDMKSFMEGQEMDAIKSALEDEDVAGMVREIKALAEKSGLEISEDEIKKRVIDIMKSDDPSAFEDLKDEDEGDGWGEMEDGIEHILLLSDHSLTADKVKDIIVDAVGGNSVGTFSHVDVQKTDESGYLIHYLVYTIDIQVMGRRWELPKDTKVLGAWSKADQAYEKHQDALSIWVYGDQNAGSNQGAALCLTMVAAACVEKFKKKVLAVICGGQVVEPDDYMSVADQFRNHQGFPVENFLRPDIRPAAKSGQMYMGTFGMVSLLGEEIRIAQPISIQDGQDRWNDLLWMGERLVRIGKLSKAMYVPGQFGYTYYLSEKTEQGERYIKADMTDVLLMDDAEEIYMTASYLVSGLSRVRCVIRPMCFLLWADKAGLLTSRCHEDLNAYLKTHKDPRNFVWSRNGGQLTSKDLNKEGIEFAKAYYNVNIIIQEQIGKQPSYYEDLAEYTKPYTTRRRADTLAKLYLNTPILLKWEPKIVEDIEAILQKRYEEWKAGK